MDRAREELLKRLTVSNGNSECKKALRALPSDPEPTIAQKIEACNCIATPEHSAVLQAQIFANALTSAQEDNRNHQEQTAVLQMQVLAEALPAFKETIKNQQEQNLRPCHNCGKEGHFTKNCNKPKKKKIHSKSIAGVKGVVMALKTLAKYMDTIVTRRETASTAQDRGA